MIAGKGQVPTGGKGPVFSGPRPPSLPCFQVIPAGPCGIPPTKKLLPDPDPVPRALWSQMGARASVHLVHIPIQFFACLHGTHMPVHRARHTLTHALAPTCTGNSSRVRVAGQHLGSSLRRPGPADPLLWSSGLLPPPPIPLPLWRAQQSPQGTMQPPSSCSSMPVLCTCPLIESLIIHQVPIYSLHFP